MRASYRISSLGKTGLKGAVFAWDRATGQSVLASHANGNPTDAALASLRALSGNGRYVFFTAWTNLTADGSDWDSDADHYRFDRATGANILVSRNFGVFAGPVDASYHGEWVVYGDGYVQLFDARTGQTRAVDHLPGSTMPSEVGYSEGRSISADGRYIVYSSTSPDLVVGQIDPVSNSADAFIYDRDTGENVLLTHPTGSPRSAAGGLGGERPLISTNGNVVAFSSSAPSFVTGDTNHHADVLAYTRSTGQLLALSLRAADLPSASANRSSWPVSGAFASATRASFSADSQQVLFETAATNLVPGQPDDGRGAIPETGESVADVYLRDRSAGSTTMVSHAPLSATRRGNRPSTDAAISADGRFVAYVSAATDLVAPGVAQGFQNVYLFDRTTGTNTLVSRSATNASLNANGDSTLPALSSDGRFVLFQSTAPDLVPGQVDGNSGEAYRDDVFLYDRLTAAMTLVSHRWDSFTTSGNKGTVMAASLSLDGRYVAFASGATDLISNQSGPAVDNVFLFDRSTGSNVLVSHAFGAPSQGAANTSALPALSGDGRYLAYRSYGANIVAGGAVTASFVYLFELLSGTNFLVSNRDFLDSATPRGVMISSDGRFVAYESRGREVTDQVDALKSTDVFLFDAVTGDRALVSHTPGSASNAGFADSSLRGISSDGRLVLFATDAQNLDPGRVGSGISVQLFDRLTGHNLLVSRMPGQSIAFWEHSHG